MCRPAGERNSCSVRLPFKSFESQLPKGFGLSKVKMEKAGQVHDLGIFAKLLSKDYEPS